MSETLELTMQDQPAKHRGREFDALSAVARRKLGVGPSWEIYAWQRLASDDVLVEGAVPSHPKAKRGNRRWQGCKGDKVVVTRAEAEAATAEYERTTGNCAKCEGRREEWHGWNHTTGHSYRPCTRCNATGRIQPSEDA